MNLTTFKTLVLREYWENRSFAIAPIIISSVVLFSLVVLLITGQSLISTHGFDNNFDVKIGELSNMDAQGLGEALMAYQFGIIFSPMIVGLLFILFFYSLGSLYNERRDRSILFWKSMPVSDTQTVLSKVFSAFLLAPVITSSIAVVSQFIGLILLTLFVWINGQSAWDLVWSQSSFFTVVFNDFSVAIMVAAWMAPILGWLWLVSAYAKRAAFLIAILVPLGVIFVEALVMHHAYFAEILGQQFALIESIGDSVMKDGHPFGILSEMRFWGGLVVSAAFISGAIFLRRYRDDSY